MPFHSTSGFNPKPRLIFALSLPLGIAGLEEVVELELDAEISAEEVRQQLAAEAPAGLSILSVRSIGKKEKAQVRLVRYRAPLSDAQGNGLAERIDQLMKSAECWIERTRPHQRRIDLRPYLSNIREMEGGLEIDIFVTPHGTARPEEVLRLLD